MLGPPLTHLEATMSDTEITIRSLKADLGSEQMHSSALETGFSRVRVILDSEKSIQAQNRDIRKIAFGMVGAPDLPA